MTIVEHNSDKKYVVVRIKEFDLHPVFCRCLEGYFVTFATLVSGTKTKCKEIKCTFEGDGYHDYLIEY